MEGSVDFTGRCRLMSVDRIVSLKTKSVRSNVRIVVDFPDTLCIVRSDDSGLKIHEPEIHNCLFGLSASRQRAKLIEYSKICTFDL